MRAAGLADVAIHELPAVVSFPQHAECRVVAPVEIALQANTLGHSLLTLEDGIEGELLDAGGAFSDDAGKDARGRRSLPAVLPAHPNAAQAPGSQTILRVHAHHRSGLQRLHHSRTQVSIGAS
jgi:hypothetical protein